MDLEKIHTSMRVKTSDILGDSPGLMVRTEHISARKPNKEGRISGIVSGHGGNAWWVTHDDGTVGAYLLDEIEPV